jgi:hypothetical protein
VDEVRGSLQKEILIIFIVRSLDLCDHAPLQLAAILVRHIGGQPDLFIRLGKQLLCSGRMTSELVFIGSLCLVEFLICLNNKSLRGREIAVSMRVDVDDWGLGKCDSGKRKSQQ